MVMQYFPKGGVPQFTPYVYNASLAAGAIYNPAAKTIVMVAALFVANKLNIQYGSLIVRQGSSEPTNDNGYIGATYCDGTYIGFKNTDTVSRTLYLFGVTMA